MDNKFLYILEF